MKIFAETDRLILREILPSDEEGMFEMDSDKEVHTYIRQPAESIEQSRALITSVRQQYIDFGIGRWAMIEKSTDNFVGWSGLKLVTQTINGHANFYDIGYRLIKRYWGKGYATESATPPLRYGFENLPVDEIYAYADMKNMASRNVLTKIGLSFIETFDHEGYAMGWYKISRDEWSKKQPI